MDLESLVGQLDLMDTFLHWEMLKLPSVVFGLQQEITPQLHVEVLVDILVCQALRNWLDPVLLAHVLVNSLLTSLMFHVSCSLCGGYSWTLNPIIFLFKNSRLSSWSFSLLVLCFRVSQYSHQTARLLGPRLVITTAFGRLLSQPNFWKIQKKSGTKSCECVQTGSPTPSPGHPWSPQVAPGSPQVTSGSPSAHPTSPQVLHNGRRTISYSLSWSFGGCITSISSQLEKKEHPLYIFRSLYPLQVAAVSLDRNWLDVTRLPPPPPPPPSVVYQVGSELSPSEGGTGQPSCILVPSSPWFSYILRSGPL